MLFHEIHQLAIDLSIECNKLSLRHRPLNGIATWTLKVTIFTRYRQNRLSISAFAQSNGVIREGVHVPELLSTRTAHDVEFLLACFMDCLPFCPQPRQRGASTLYRDWCGMVVGV